MLLNDFKELPLVSLLFIASITLASSFVSGIEALGDSLLPCTPPIVNYLYKPELC